MEVGSNGNYFRGAGKQAHSFGDLGSPDKKQKKNKGKATILFDFLSFLMLLGRWPPDPLVNSKCIYFLTNMHI